MSLEHLDKVMNTRRCPRQRAVIRELLKGRMTARSIARATGATENAVNIALSELKARGIVTTPIRGRFYVNETLVALALLDRVRSLERKLIRKVITVTPGPSSPAKGEKSLWKARGHTPTSAATEVG